MHISIFDKWCTIWWIYPSCIHYWRLRHNQPYNSLQWPVRRIVWHMNREITWMATTWMGSWMCATIYNTFRWMPLYMHNFIGNSVTVYMESVVYKPTVTSSMWEYEVDKNVTKLIVLSLRANWVVTWPVPWDTAGSFINKWLTRKWNIRKFYDFQASQL